MKVCYSTQKHQELRRLSHLVVLSQMPITQILILWQYQHQIPPMVRMQQFSPLVMFNLDKL